MIKRTARLAITSILVLGLAACWTPERIEAAHAASAQRFRETQLSKAAFTLDCPAAALEVHLVPEGDPFPDNALVSGCGRKATFVKVGGLWVMDSASKPM